MPPSQKKPQGLRHEKNVTLLDFFGSDAAASKKQHIKTPPARAKRKEISVTLSPEIIVIDSDSDNDFSAKRKGKTKTYEQSSGDKLGRRLKENVGIHDRGNTIGKKRKVEISNIKEEPQTTVSISDLRGEGPSTLFGQPSTLLQEGCVDHQMSFGEPSSLLSPSGSTENKGHSVYFGSPNLLLGPSNAVNSPRDSIVHDTFLDAGHFENKIEDDWATGDDEMALLGDLEQNDAIEDAGIFSIEDHSLTSDSKICPICAENLSGLSMSEIDVHMNLCLEGTSPLKPPDTQVPDIPVSDEKSCEVGSYTKVQCRRDASNKGVFSVLMSSYKENEAWREAEAVENRSFRPTRAKGSRRQAPFYKVLQGMPITVDAFKYGTIPGVTAYFLTHAHSDHYTNLSSNWKSGYIYCSEDTAKLIMHMLAVDPKWVRPLPMDVPTVIPDTGGVTVTLIEANHCPGSCLFFFEGLQTINAGDSAYKSPFVGSSKIYRYLHCGDFRASPRHVLHPVVKGKRIDHVYLDTTYLDPKYTFPPQPLVISACAELAKRIVAGQIISQTDSDNKKMPTIDTWVSIPPKSESKKEVKLGRILVVVGTYSIGKERIVKAIAKALETKVYCDARKAAILRCQSDPELHSLLTSDPLEGGVHLLPLGMIVTDKLKLYLERFKGIYSRVVGFRPTGWTYTPPAGSEQTPSIPSIISRSQQRSFTYANLRPMQKSSYAFQMFGVPYSEHSSFFELTCFAMSFDWGKMIATVNVGSESSRAKMAKWVERWEAERKRRGQDTIVEFRDADYW